MTLFDKGTGQLLRYLLPDVWISLKMLESSVNVEKHAIFKQQAALEMRNKQIQDKKDAELRQIETMLANSLKGEPTATKTKSNPIREAQQTQAQAQPSKTPPIYTIDNLNKDLNKIVGLEQVKSKVRDIFYEMQVRQQRMKRGIGSDEDNNSGMHMVFLGNPGTGKTSIARLVGEVLAKMGILPSGHFTEINAGDLIGEYIGHSENKTKAVLSKAMGGVLFIDEAYSLINKDNPGASDFGKKAMDELILQMENHRQEICVIMAGYTEEMKYLMEKANTGLKSRIQYVINFPDYTPDELMSIFKYMYEKASYYPNGEAIEYTYQIFKDKQSEYGKLGNGRFVRKYLDKAIKKHARIIGSDIRGADTQALTSLTLEDVKAWSEEEAENELNKS